MYTYHLPGRAVHNERPKALITGPTADVLGAYWMGGSRGFTSEPVMKKLHKYSRSSAC